MKRYSPIPLQGSSENSSLTTKYIPFIIATLLVTIFVPVLVSTPLQNNVTSLFTGNNNKNNGDLIPDDGHVINVDSGDPWCHQDVLRNLTNNNHTAFVSDSLDQSYLSSWDVAMGDTDSVLRGYYASLGQPIPSTSRFIYVKGATEALVVIINALQQVLKTQINVSTTHFPYYGAYSSSVAAAKGNFIHPLNVTDWSTITLQVLTSPNNPDGQVSSPKPGSKYVVIDRVYDVPHFTGLFDRSVNGDNLMKVDMFYDSVTKSAGWPALRHGWIVLHSATTTNAELYMAMLSYTMYTTMGPITISHQMLTNLINFHYENNFLFYHINYQTLSSRHAELRSVVPEEYWLTATDNAPYFYIHVPSTVFSRFNITSRSGTGFGDTNDKTRFMIMPHQNDWDLFIQRLKFIFSTNSYRSMIEEHKARAVVDNRLTVSSIMSKRVDFENVKPSDLNSDLAKLILSKYHIDEIPSHLANTMHELSTEFSGC